jgi:hypothetical protein
MSLANKALQHMCVPMAVADRHSAGVDLQTAAAATAMGAAKEAHGHVVYIAPAVVRHQGRGRALNLVMERTCRFARRRTQNSVSGATGHPGQGRCRHAAAVCSRTTIKYVHTRAVLRAHPLPDCSSQNNDSGVEQ